MAIDAPRKVGLSTKAQQPKESVLWSIYGEAEKKQIFANSNETKKPYIILHLPAPIFLFPRLSGGSVFGKHEYTPHGTIKII